MKPHSNDATKASAVQTKLSSDDGSWGKFRPYLAPRALKLAVTPAKFTIAPEKY